MNSPKIILIGPPGAGKSTVGKALAKKMNCTFADTDRLIEAEVGKKISILSPGIDLKKYSSLPFASSLCGSCSDVCPVKINIHDQLYRWRQEIMQQNKSVVQGKIFNPIAGFFLASPFWYRMLSSMVMRISKVFPGVLKSSLLVWGKQRDFPPVPRQTFRDWFDQNAGK